MAQLKQPRWWLSSPGTRRLVDRLLASDPGLQRLRSATRVTLATIAAALVSYLLIVRVGGGTTVAPLFGGVVAMLAAMSVRDNSLAGRKITTFLLLLPASVSVTAGGLLSSVLWAQWLALSVIVFCAFYVRRFGPRYVALGVMAGILFFVSSIVSSILGLGPAQLPWIIAAMALGVLCIYLVRFYLLPDNPYSVLRRSLAAFDVQLQLTLEAITDTLADRRSDEVRSKRLRREASRLHERASAAEGQLLAEEAEIYRQRSDRLRLHLFDSEMSVNTLAEIVWSNVSSSCDFPEEIHSALLRALGELCAGLRHKSNSAGETLSALQHMEDARARASAGESDAAWSFQVRRAYAAIRQLSEAAGEEQDEVPVSTEEGYAADREEDEQTEENRGSPRRDGIAGRLRPTTVQGIQATLAVSLALGAGQILSPSRPYWVVIIAFVVFIGSGTFGDTLTKSFQRTVGTLLGAVAGFFLAEAVSGLLYLEGALIVACIFLAFYMFSISQTLMMFWITVLLAVAFDIVGLLDGGGILALRFFDTLLGSVIGLGVSALVFPTRPSDEFRELTAAFLDSLDGYVRDRVRWLAGGEANRPPVGRAREVEARLDALVDYATTARRQAMVFGRSRAELDRWMTGLLALNYYALHLAGPVGRSQRLQPGSTQSQNLGEIGERISANIGLLQEGMSTAEEPEIADIEELMQRLEHHLAKSPEGEDQVPQANAPAAVLFAMVSPVPGRSGPTNALHYLRRINRTLGELAEDPALGSRRY